MYHNRSVLQAPFATVVLNCSCPRHFPYFLYLPRRLLFSFGLFRTSSYSHLSPFYPFHSSPYPHPKVSILPSFSFPKPTFHIRTTEHSHTQHFTSLLLNSRSMLLQNRSFLLNVFSTMEILVFTSISLVQSDVNLHSKYLYFST